MLCSMFARALAQCGAKVALLDINEEAAKKAAGEIAADGFAAKGYACDCLSKESCQAAREQIHRDFGPCDILLNGAGGNNPRATTDKEYYEDGDLLDPEVKSFFDLEPAGVEFVFNLNFLGVLLPTQVFAQDMLEKKEGAILNISSMNAYTPLTKIPAYSGAKARGEQLHPDGVCSGALRRHRHPGQRHRPGLFGVQPEPGPAVPRGRHPHPPAPGKILAGTPMGRFGDAEELVGGGAVPPLQRGGQLHHRGWCCPSTAVFSAYSGVMSTLPQRVYQLVAQIPKGNVATYGQLALLAGSPRASRIVGAAMFRAPAGLPCHRVLYRDGTLCCDEAFGGEGDPAPAAGSRRRTLPPRRPGGFEALPVAWPGGSTLTIGVIRR